MSYKTVLATQVKKTCFWCKVMHFYILYVFQINNKILQKNTKLSEVTYLYNCTLLKFHKLNFYEGYNLSYISNIYIYIPYCEKIQIILKNIKRNKIKWSQHIGITINNV